MSEDKLDPLEPRSSGLSPSTISGLGAFWAELKCRKVMRVAITYAVVVLLED